jgi:hypothetical protein
MKLRIYLLLMLAGVATLPSRARAGALYNVSIDTSSLIGNAAGPFSLDFQLTDGSGTNDGNNTVTLSNIVFGTGSPSGTASTSGDVSGDLASGLTLIDSDFLNEFTQTFTPGGVLSFAVNLTGNVDAGGVPDEFTLGILDNTNSEIPTLGLFDTVLLAYIDSSQPTLFSYGSDPSRGTAATGETLSLSAPVITSPTTATAEPSALWLSAGALALLALRRRSRIGEGARA